MKAPIRWALVGLVIGAAIAETIVMGSGRVAHAAGSSEICNQARPSTPDAALRELLEGNARWAAGAPNHPGQDADRRTCVFQHGQTPYAAILACSDSRVGPELVFDTGVGDVFAVRDAGNTADTIGAESLGYAVEHLGAPLIMVVGHQNCGAAKAAADSYPKPAPQFVSAIYDSVAQAKKSNPQDLAAATIDQHVIDEVTKLRGQHPFKELIAAGKLRIVGGRYDLNTGKVVMLIQ
jgi:carbonic anhydrase